MKNETNTADIEGLIAENEALKNENQTLNSHYELLKSECAYLKFQLEELKRQVFGRKSERFVPANDNQLSLFEETLPEQEAEQHGQMERISYERKKATRRKHPGRTPIPAHFPVVETIVEPEEDTEGLVKIGEEISEHVEYTPPVLTCHRTIRPKYVKPIADQGSRILIAELPPRPIPKSIAGASLLAHLFVSKFVDHLPFYRLIKRFERENQWSLKQSTINSWFTDVSNLMKPLFEELHARTMNTDYLQADESTIKVLTKLPKDEKGKPKVPKKVKGSGQMLGYMWVVHNVTDGLVCFQYLNTRSGESAQEILESFTEGYLQVDGHDSYNKIAERENVHRLGCMAHARRKFFEAQGNDPQRATYALEFFHKVYELEREETTGMTPDERKVWREENLKPLYEQFKTWVDAQLYTPKSPIGGAFTYIKNQWDTLMTLFMDGRLLLDNNRIENKIRPLALGRKNYMFAGSHDAAQRIAMMYSFFATCKIHDISPFEWLTDTLNRIMVTKLSNLHELLPTADWQPLPKRE